MITWIAGWPHNGSTLLRQILKCCFDMQTLSVYPEPQFEFIFGKAPVEFAKQWAENPLVRLEYSQRLPEIQYIKTHEIVLDNSPALYVVRDGRDVVTALSHFWKSPIRFIIAGIGGTYGNWSTHYYSWNYPKRKDVKIIRFEDMVLKPDEVAADVGEFLNCDPKQKYVDDFEENKNLWSQLFHDRIDCWKKRMSSSDLKYFWKCHGDLMRELGYE